jgi:PAS domain S-box-containing protein
LGYSREELLQLSPQDIDVEEQLEKMPQLIERLMAKGHALFETFHVPKEGQKFPVEISAHLLDLDDQPAILSIARDITRRKQAESEIRRRNRELSLLNRIIAASAEDLEPKAFLETACRELALAFDVPQVAACLLNESRTTAVFVAEYRTEERKAALNGTLSIGDIPPLQRLFNDKELLVVNDAQNDPRLTQIRDLICRYDIASSIALPLVVNGEAVGGLILETNEQRIFSPEEVKLAWSVADQVAGALARAQLTQDHQRLITAIEQAAETIFITNPQGTIVYVNPAFERTTGYSQTEAVGRNPRILKSGQQDPAFYRDMWTTLAAGEIWQGRLVNKKKDGSRYTVETTISPVRDKEGKLVNYVVVQRDVTHELQLQKQYRQAQKMEAVGRLAGGIAHDFNNILTIISGHAELLLDQYSDPDDWLHKEIREIRQASEQATTLTQQLLTFSRQQPLQLRVLNLNEVISKLEKMLKRLIGENIKLSTNLSPTLGPVEVDPGQFEQVIMNLAVNARDAMPYGGKLILKTANVALDQEDVEKIPDIEPGAYVLLSVTDTGFGMDAETQAHIFEPFFTTKGKSKGTGLGLATVYGIVQQSKGHISVSTAPGEGTIFKIYLPQVKEPVEPAKPAKPTPATVKTKRGSVTILLVEDDPAVRLITNKFLQKRGYTVLEALDSTEAVQICRQHEGPIHLLLTDVVMPRMSGFELAKHLTALRPQMKVLYISGYSDEELSHYEHATSGAGLLQKPFTSELLIHKIREILSQS